MFFQIDIYWSVILSFVHTCIQLQDRIKTFFYLTTYCIYFDIVVESITYIHIRKMEEAWSGLYISKENYNMFSDQRIYLCELSVARLQPCLPAEGCSLATESSYK